MYRIFIVEDDAVIAKAICDSLAAWGYEARAAVDFSEILREFTAFAPQLVLMDIGLPFFNGFHWCREIRQVSRVPIVFLSSASDNMNIVMALNMGGDDFIPKPFDLNVLSAKVQAMLRRSYDYQGESTLLEHRGLLFSPSEGSMVFGTEKTDLTKNENRIMRTLLENKGKIVSRDTLMNALWACDAFVDENALSVNVTRLRRKLAALGLEDFISTKKGEGYLVR